MFKKFLFFTLCSLLLTACSTKEKSIESEASAEPKEELSPLEEISKVCLKSIDECDAIFKEKGELIDREFSEGKEVIERYLLVYNTLASKNSVEYKTRTMDENMKFLKSKGYPTLIKYNKKLGNEYYAQFLEDILYPRAQVYNSKNLTVGMDMFDLILSMGYPNKINKTTTSNGVSAQWVYRDLDVYVYLDDSIVTSFQN